MPIPPIYYYWGNWDSQGEWICPSPHWLMRGKNYKKSKPPWPPWISHGCNKAFPEGIAPKVPWATMLPFMRAQDREFHFYTSLSTSLPECSFFPLANWCLFWLCLIHEILGPVSILVWKGAPRSLGALSTAHSSSYPSPPGLDMATGQNSRKPTNRCQTPLLTKDEW